MYATIPQESRNQPISTGGRHHPTILLYFHNWELSFDSQRFLEHCNHSRTIILSNATCWSVDTRDELLSGIGFDVCRCEM